MGIKKFGIIFLFSLSKKKYFWGIVLFLLSGIPVLILFQKTKLEFKSQTDWEVSQKGFYTSETMWARGLELRMFAERNRGLDQILNRIS